MAHRQLAEEHRSKAVELLESIKPARFGGKGVGETKDVATASRANTHATLALFHQREADRAGES